jgi:hypothetical protein
MVKTNNMGYKQIPANTGQFLPVSVSVFGVPNTGIPVSVYTGLETLVRTYNAGLSFALLLLFFLLLFLRTH